MSERSTGFVAGLVAGLALAAVVLTAAGGLGEDPDAVDEARAAIERSYFEPVGPKTLEEASIEGIVRELRRRHDDRFSHYFPPRDLDEFNAATSGKFSGVGLTVSEVRRGLRVASVIPDTPAERAGIEEGDVITHVDGRSIAGLPVQVSSGKIKGRPGTEVDLRVVSAATGKAREVTLERAEVQVPAVSGTVREVRRSGARPAEASVAYVRFASFSRGAHGELRETVERLYRRGAEGLLLDLRGNGGGLLNEAVLASSVFVEDGLVVSTDSRAQGHVEYEAKGDALQPRPTVVLINGDTASAAEILTAALAEHGLATVAGTRSFGKGSFQEVIHLESGGALDLTVGEYLTADGASLADRGIRPDVRAVDDAETGADEALRRALRVLAAELASSR